MKNRENVPFIIVISYDYKYPSSWRCLIDSLFRAPLSFEIDTEAIFYVSDWCLSTFSFSV